MGADRLNKNNESSLYKSRIVFAGWSLEPGRGRQVWPRSTYLQRYFILYISRFNLIPGDISFLPLSKELPRRQITGIGSGSCWIMSGLIPIIFPTSPNHGFDAAVIISIVDEISIVRSNYNRAVFIQYSANSNAS